MSESAKPTYGSELVRRERRGQVLVISIDRPEAHNAINLALVGALQAAIDELETTSEIRVGVLTGAGKGFCSGMDLRAFAAGEPVWTGTENAGGLRELVARHLSKPLVASIEGFAVAGGLELALLCDLIVCGGSAKLGLPEVKRGLVAKAGGLRRLPRRVGIGNAARMALTGELISGAAGKEIGLVDELTADGEALSVALSIAGAIASNGPLAINATKEILCENEDWSEEDFWHRQSAIVASIFASEDALEGARAFAERRDPVWRGK